MRKHLAIFSGDNAELILNGQKTIETRFSKSRISPFGQVSVGDIVYIKPSGGDIIGQFRVNKVISFQGLDQEDMLNIQKMFNKKIHPEESCWKNKNDSKFGTVIIIGECTRLITSPIKIPKMARKNWMVLS